MSARASSRPSGGVLSGVSASAGYAANTSEYRIVMDEEICTQDLRAAGRDPPLNRYPAVHAEGPRKGDGSSRLPKLPRTVLG
jgi:hypothetical protein